MIMNINDFVQKQKLRNNTKSNVENQQKFFSLSLIDVGIYLIDGLFSSDLRFVELRPKGLQKDFIRFVI